MNKHPDFNKEGLHVPTGFYWGPNSQIDGNDYSAPDVSLYWAMDGVLMTVCYVAWLDNSYKLRALIGVDEIHPKIST